MERVARHAAHRDRSCEVGRKANQHKLHSHRRANAAIQEKKSSAGVGHG